MNDNIKKGIDAMAELMTTDQLMRSAQDAATVAETTAKSDPRTARVWADISAAWSMAARVAFEREQRMTYTIVEDPHASSLGGQNVTMAHVRSEINPHQRIGGLSDDEIETVMALRRGDAAVVPAKSDPRTAELDNDERAMYGRLFWCLMDIECDEGDGQKIIVSRRLWEKSVNGRVSIKTNDDGSRTITRS